MWKAERPHGRRGASFKKVTGKGKRPPRDLSQLKADENELAVLLDEVGKSTDRSACIIQSAMVERHVETAIVLRLKRGDDESVRPLFEQGGALSTFSAKIHLGYAMGLFDAPIREDLESINGIRHVFAHSSLVLTFDTEEITNQLRKFRCLEYSDIYDAVYLEHFPEGKRRFSACCLAVIEILTESIEEHVAELQSNLKDEISKSIVSRLKKIPGLFVSFIERSPMQMRKGSKRNSA